MSTKSNDLTYIDQILNSISDVLSSPESALLLSSLYDNSVGISDINKNEPIGPVLFRENEDLISCTRLSSLIKLYKEYDIGKFFNINITEFMDLPGWQINVLVKNAEEFMEEMNKEIKELENEVIENKKNSDGIIRELGE